MTKTKSIFKLFFLLLFTINLVSCLDEEAEKVKESIIPIAVDFNLSTVTISEQAAINEIKVDLTRTASKDGIITIAVETNHSEYFNTAPQLIDGIIEIPVLKGETSAKFTLTPIDNNMPEENKVLDLTIAAVTDGFVIGNKKTMVVTIIENDQLVSAQFTNTSGTLNENNLDGHIATIGLSHNKGEGTVELTINTGADKYGEDFITQPEAVNGKITFTVTEGMTNLPLKIIPINNTFFISHSEIELSISHVSGNIILGNLTNYKVALLDDELIGMPKGFESSGGAWATKQTYEYNKIGKIAKIHWVQNTLSGTYIYHYNENNELVKITESDLKHTRFIRNTQGKIIKSEKYNDGVLKQYTQFNYDDFGNIGEAAVFNLQPSGQFAMTQLFVYLYYQNNSLYKRMMYNPADVGEDFDLIQEETYTYVANYQAINPFPMVQIVPDINVQPSLPLTYVLSRDGNEYSYQLSYELNAAGLPVRRTVTGGENATYQYY